MARPHESRDNDLSTLQVEARCLGNVVSLRLQIVQRSLIYLPVMINHTGLYGVASSLHAEISYVELL
jgi:hypothetical protein